jgi:hypothetical protein
MAYNLIHLSAVNQLILCHKGSRPRLAPESSGFRDLAGAHNLTISKHTRKQ